MRHPETVVARGHVVAFHEAAARLLAQQDDTPFPNEILQDPTTLPSQPADARAGSYMAGPAQNR